MHRSELRALIKKLETERAEFDRALARLWALYRGEYQHEQEIRPKKAKARIGRPAAKAVSATSNNGKKRAAVSQSARQKMSEAAKRRHAAKRQALLKPVATTTRTRSKKR